MKNSQIVIFFTVVFTIYSLANIYIFLKGYNSIAKAGNFRILYTLVFIILALAFIAGKILETRHSSVVSDILNIIGGFWLAFMLYGVLFLLFSDIIYFSGRLTGIIRPEKILWYKKWAFIITVCVSVIIIASGFINAIIPHVKEYNITIHKKTEGPDKLRIAAVSDIHLGSVIRKRSIKKLSATLGSMKPDVIFLVGDVVDGEVGPVMRGDLLKYFNCPRCRFGMYAITGNHEFIGGADKTIPYIESKGIRVLKDEVVILDGGIQVAGRLDRDSRRYYGKDRLPLAKILENTDKSRPLILLDHQPLNLDEAVKNGVDLQISGHTHNGQMWPLNYITRGIYELSYGYLKKGNTHFIVSSGYGLWGPRTRSGSKSEVLLINITFGGQ
ncbi:MAG: metallophosphoesterase [Bacteroidales bacterium]|nr:metallophosphoesterase [Bacteroidales bacterium]